jgi:glycosyltransferase involved in cell wall biosynthesis
MEYSATLPGVYLSNRRHSNIIPLNGESKLKVLGLSTYSITHNGERYVGKHSDLFNTIAKHYNLIDVGSVQIKGFKKIQQRLMYFRPDRAKWHTASSMNVMAFRERTRRAEAYLNSYEGKYDFIFQLHTTLAPGYNLANRPYVIATDNTYMLSERYWSEWVPVKRDRDAWIQHETEVYQNASCIFTWSEFARQSIINDYGIHPRKVLATGSAGGFQIDDEPKQDYSKPVALFVGNDFERKGGFVLLKAWEEVTKQIPDAELWIVGPREPLASPMQGVKWMGRISDRAALKEMFRQSSVFVLPSLFEPFAMALLEGMGVGLPCIGAKAGGIPEMIIEGGNGLLVEPNDSVSLANALVKVLSNPQLAKTMGHHAHRIARQQFTWDDIVGRMQSSIERAFAGEAQTVHSRPRELLSMAMQ